MSYCYTCHSKQGCSVDDDIVIYDWSKWYCSKNWYWTAITRARDFNRVEFFFQNADEKDMSKIRVQTYLKNTSMNFEEQDRKAGRDVENGDGSLDPSGRSRDYVDVDFLMNLMNTQCENCNEPLVIYFEDGKVSSNISCQRVNHDVAHFKDNCIGLWVQYNCAFSNKISL